MPKGDPGYPDDIRSYDNHPSSPFYVEPNWVCDECNELNDGSEEECIFCLSLEERA